MKKVSGLLLLFLTLLLFNRRANAQKDFDGIRGTKHWPMFTDASNSFYHYIAGQAYQDLEKTFAKSGRYSYARWMETTAKMDTQNIE